MKQFNFKKIMLMSLAVLTLFACGKKDDGGGDDNSLTERMRKHGLILSMNAQSNNNQSFNGQGVGDRLTITCVNTSNQNVTNQARQQLLVELARSGSSVHYYKIGSTAYDYNSFSSVIEQAFYKLDSGNQNNNYNNNNYNNNYNNNNYNNNNYNNNYNNNNYNNNYNNNNYNNNNYGYNSCPDSILATGSVMRYNQYNNNNNNNNQNYCDYNYCN